MFLQLSWATNLSQSEYGILYLANISAVKSAANLLAVVLKFAPFFTIYFFVVLEEIFKKINQGKIFT